MIPPPTKEELETLITILCVLILLVGWYLLLAPVGECSSCAHCQKERREKVKSDGGGSCPLCRKNHRPDEPHAN
jgi:hypothetical protein